MKSFLRSNILFVTLSIFNAISSLNSMHLLTEEQKALYDSFVSKKNLNNLAYSGLEEKEKEILNYESYKDSTMSSPSSIILDHDNALTQKRIIIEKFIRSYYEKGMNSGQIRLDKK